MYWLPVPEWDSNYMENSKDHHNGSHQELKSLASWYVSHQGKHNTAGIGGTML